MLKSTTLFSSLTLFCSPIFGQDVQDVSGKEEASLISEENELTFCRPKEVKPACEKPRKKTRCCEEKPPRHGVYLSGSGGGGERLS